MKKINLIIAILLISIITNAQGWIGNTTTNSIAPYNSALGLAPMNIGIGTATPTEQLHTNLGVRFEGLTRNDTPNRIIVQNTSGKLFWRDASTIGSGQAWNLTGNNNAINPGVGTNQNYLGTSSNHKLVFATGGNTNLPIERMTIMNNTGRIGINNSNPNELLHMNNGNFMITQTNTDTTLPITIGTQNSFARQKSRLMLSSEAASLNASIHGKTILHSWWGVKIIGSKQSLNNLTNYERGDNDSIPVFEVATDVTNTTFTRGPMVRISGAGNSNLQEWVDNNNSIQGIFTSTGNFGIGTNNPQNRLHVEGGANITSMPMNQVGDNLVFQEPTTGELRSLSPGAPNTFLSGDGTWQPVTAGATTNSLVFINPNTITSTVNGISSTITIPVNSSNTINNCGAINMVPRLTGVNTYSCGSIFDNGAAVGIGNTGPFTYSTSAWRSTGATTTGTLRLRVAGNVQGTHFVATSDKTLKTDIKSIVNASQLINKIEGKTYVWKEEYQKESGVDNGRHYGFLAQDIEKVIPEAVIIDEKGRYAVEYNAVIPVLVESQKELIAENNALKSKLASFEEKFALLEKSILTICESGCDGLKNANTSSDVDVLYQSIPNPTDDIAIINYILVTENADAAIVINTQEGKQIQAYKLESKLGAGSVKVSLGELSSGTYLYTLTVGGHVVDTKRLQIVK